MVLVLEVCLNVYSAFRLFDSPNWQNFMCRLNAEYKFLFLIETPFFHSNIVPSQFIVGGLGHSPHLYTMTGRDF